MKRQPLMAGIVAGMLSAAVTGAAQGQHRVDNSRANDANNRLGSGGYNDGRPRDMEVTGNQIVTGNVTAGREFRGEVGYRDPREFRGRTSGDNVDRFVRQSAGAPTGGNPNNNAMIPRAFYGESRAVNPPGNFVREGFSGGYVPAPPTNLARQPGDLRLGAPIDAPIITLPEPGELILPGPVDAESQQQTMLTASPLYGIRQWRMDDEQDQYFLSRYSNINRERGGRDRFGLDNATIQRMREELNETMVPEGQEGAGQEGQRDPNLAQPLPAPLESPENQTVSGQGINGQVGGQQQALDGQVNTQQGVRQRLLIPANQQSTQYAELQQRLERYQKDNPITAQADASREFNRQLQARNQADAKIAQEKADAEKMDQQARELQQKQQATAQPGQPGGTDEAEQTPQNQMPEFSNPDAEKRAQAAKNKPAPLKVSSLAQGVKAKGLADFLTAAEKLMKEGKYTSAMDQYEMAEQIAPNNPLIVLGKANAELGASYYARAELHLRNAFTADPALLMGQYDLRAFLGQDRLQFIVQELKKIANDDKKQARPLFLLAYIAYNTDNARRAAGYLELAEKRAGGNDPVYQLIREHWTLPTDAEGDASEPETNEQDVNK